MNTICGESSRVQLIQRKTHTHKRTQEVVQIRKPDDGDGTNFYAWEGVGYPVRRK